MISHMITPLGKISIDWRPGEGLAGIDLVPAQSAPHEYPPKSSCDLLMAIEAQLLAYFQDASFRFSLPLSLAGSHFMREVWGALRTIPSGEVRTYGALARQLGTAPRAIGLACRSNPCPLVIPCHRIVGARGLGGFAGATGGQRLAIKRWLLSHEGYLEGNGLPA